MSWKESKLGIVCDIIGGKPAPKEPDAFDADGIPFVRMKDLGRYHLTTDLVETDDKVSLAYAKKNNFIPVPKGAILIPRSGSVALNHRAILGQDSIIVSHICALNVKDETELSNKFLYYLLCRYDMNQIAKKTTGLDAINFSDLGNINIAYPDLDTQNKIVAILDKANVLVKKREATIAKYDELLRAIFLDMFDSPIKNSKGFPIVTVEDVSVQIKDGPHVSPQYVDNGIPILSTRNIRPGKYVPSDLKFVSKDIYQKLIRYFKPEKGDVIITKGGSTGFAKVIDWDFDFCIWVHLAVVRLKDEINSYYFESFINSAYGYYQTQRFTHGIANKDLGLKRIAKIKLLLPPVELQRRFESIYLHIEKSIRVNEEFKSNLIELISGLSQLAFKGELTFNTAVELEAFLNKIDLEKDDKENDISNAIVNNALLRLLITRLKNQEFETLNQYEKGKYVVFRILKENKQIIRQQYNSKDKQVELIV